MSIARDIYNRNIRRRSLLDRNKYARIEAERAPHELTKSRFFTIFRFNDGSGLKFAKNDSRAAFYITDDNQPATHNAQEHQ